MGVFPVNSLQASAVPSWLLQPSEPTLTAHDAWCTGLPPVQTQKEQETGLCLLKADTYTAQSLCPLHLAFQLRFSFPACSILCSASDLCLGVSLFIFHTFNFFLPPLHLHWLIYSFLNFSTTSCSAGNEAEWEKMKRPFKSVFYWFQQCHMVGAFWPMSGGGGFGNRNY